MVRLYPADGNFDSNYTAFQFLPTIAKCYTAIVAKIITHLQFVA